MKFADFMQYVFYGVMSGAAFLAVSTLGELSDSVQELNVKIAVVIEHQANTDKRVDKLWNRVYSDRHEH